MPEGAVFVAPRGALAGQGPDAAAEDFLFTVLVHQARQDLVDAVAVEQGNGLGDAALLGLDLVQFALDALRHFGDTVEGYLFFGMTQLGRYQLADAHYREYQHQDNEQDQKQRVAGLNRAQSGHGTCPYRAIFIIRECDALSGHPQDVGAVFPLFSTIVQKKACPGKNCAQGMVG